MGPSEQDNTRATRVNGDDDDRNSPTKGSKWIAPIGILITLAILVVAMVQVIGEYERAELGDLQRYEVRRTSSGESEVWKIYERGERRAPLRNLVKFAPYEDGDDAGPEGLAICLDSTTTPGIPVWSLHLLEDDGRIRRLCRFDVREGPERFGDRCVNPSVAKLWARRIDNRPMAFVTVTHTWSPTALIAIPIDEPEKARRIWHRGVISHLKVLHGHYIVAIAWTNRWIQSDDQLIMGTFVTELERLMGQMHAIDPFIQNEFGFFKTGFLKYRSLQDPQVRLYFGFEDKDRIHIVDGDDKVRAVIYSNGQVWWDQEMFPVEEMYDWLMERESQCLLGTGAWAPIS